MSAKEGLWVASGTDLRRVGRYKRHERRGMVERVRKKEGRGGWIWGCKRNRVRARKAGGRRLHAEPKHGSWEMQTASRTGETK